MGSGEARYGCPCWGGRGSAVGVPIVVCMTDADCNGTINSTDVSDFINAWFEQSGSCV